MKTNEVSQGVKVGGRREGGQRSGGRVRQAGIRHALKLGKDNHISISIEYNIDDI